MSPEEVARIAAAIAIANGHSDPTDYVGKVVEAWKTQAPARREEDVKSVIADAREERSK